MTLWLEQVHKHMVTRLDETITATIASERFGAPPVGQKTAGTQLRSGVISGHFVLVKNGNRYGPMPTEAEYGAIDKPRKVDRSYTAEEFLAGIGQVPSVFHLGRSMENRT